MPSAVLAVVGAARGGARGARIGFGDWGPGPCSAQAPLVAHTNERLPPPPTPHFQAPIREVGPTYLSDRIPTITDEQSRLIHQVMLRWSC